MGIQLAIEVPIENNSYNTALEEYNKMEKPKGHRIFLCYCESKKQYYVSWTFSREFLEYKKIKIIQ